jgi:hypothetical protein
MQYPEGLELSRLPVSRVEPITAVFSFACGTEFSVTWYEDEFIPSLCKGVSAVYLF